MSDARVIGIFLTVRSEIRAALLGVAAGALVAGSLHAALPDPGQIDFFEKQIRPVLADHCYECHSRAVAKPKGGLRLDSAQGVLTGGSRGPAVVPGKPEGSLLLQALRGHVKDLDPMPPKDSRGGALSGEQIAALEEWVRNGAIDPRVDTATAAAGKKPSDHWAFRPPAAPAIPVVQHTGWIRRPMDRFVLARMEAHGLTPSPRADLRTLLRRATFDLTGLPPTPAEMQTFLVDNHPDAYERAVERLLSSPRYGERWARIWLDVARYADTKGYVFEEERRYPYSYTYRDWVVQALNDDLPYDRFLQYQIAGDLYATAADPSPLAALGFLTLGRRFLNNETDIIDDRIDVVFRGTQALTVQCARCHDHKFDPIPTADYYSLYGVFKSTHEPAEKPMLGPSPNPEQAAEFEIERAQRVEERQKFRAQNTEAVAKKLREHITDYLLTAQESMALDGSKAESLARSRSLDPGLVGAWKDRLTRWRTQGDPLFAPWFALLESPEAEFMATATARLTALAATNSQLNPAVLSALKLRTLTNFPSVAAGYGDAFQSAATHWEAELGAARKAQQKAPEQLAEAAHESLRRLLYGPDSPIQEALGHVDRFFDVPTIQKSRALLRRIEELEATHPGAPRRAMALADNATPDEPVIFKRGNPGNRGDKVPRQFLGLLAGPDRRPFTQGSGRRELAEAITRSDNPLTARVLVNRIWLRHLGTPLVGTPSDFGLRSDPPTHPELLDHLAITFRNGGWSLKNLHRELLLSATYQQASSPATEAATREYALNEARDSGNQQYWRQNRRRLELEGLRDSLLSVSGDLDPAMKGQPVEMYGTDRTAHRRSLYGFVDRQNLPALLRAFDFASPDASSAARFQTTVPQQALYFLNSEAGVDFARRLAARPELAAAASEADRVEQLYQLLYQRSPSADEIQMGLAFVHHAEKRPLEAPEPPPSAAWSYGWGTLDDQKQRVATFHPFTVFKDTAWRPDDKFPAPDQRGYVQLTKAGGLPGPDAEHLAIRRWTSPLNGDVQISGRLRHEDKEGDGVQAWVVSSRRGIVQHWTAHRSKVEAEVDSLAVETGETLDFIVDCLGNDTGDTFQWTSTVKVLGDSRYRVWRSDTDFGGPLPVRQPLTPWARYSQVLLSANELVFVD